MSLALDLERDQLPSHLEPLTQKRRALLRALIWDGLNVADAARQSGMSENGAHIAIRSPTFQQAVTEERKVRRQAARLGNLPALERIRDQSSNPQAVVQAVKVIEAIASVDDTHASAGAAKAGIVIVIGQQAPQMADLRNEAAGPVIDVRPTVSGPGQS